MNQEFISEPARPDEGLNIREYLALFWQWAWLIALAALLAGAAAFIVSRQMQPVYRTTTTILVNEAPATRSPDYTSMMVSERLTRTYSEMMVKEPVLAEVASKLGLTVEPGLLKGWLTVQPVRDTQIIQLSAESTDPALAAAIANTVVEVFAAQIQEIQGERYAQSKATLAGQLADVEAQVNQYAAELAAATGALERDRLESKVVQYRGMYANLLQSYESVRLAEAQMISSIVSIEPAPVPAAPIRPRTMQNTLLAALVGLMLAAGAVVAREALDDTIKTPEDVTRLLGLPVLGVISHHEAGDERPISAAQPRSPVTEAFRTLRTNVQYASVDRPLRTLLVTSAEPGEGKTTIAANLAVVLAQSGRSTTLVDCDFRRPALHRRFGLANRQGLSGLFVGPNGHLNGSRQAAGVEHLGVITSGHLPPNPAELLGSQRMGVILGEVYDQSEMVVIDTPPALAVTDAAVLAPLADGVLLVVMPGRTRLPAARQALEHLRRVNARILGVVLNNLELKRSGYQYRYQHRYSYYGKKNGYKNYYEAGLGGEAAPAVPAAKAEPLPLEED